MIHSSSKKYILWDMDGTLLDSEPQHYRAWKRIFAEEFGIEVAWEHYKHAIGATEQALDRIVEEYYGKVLRGHPARKRYREMVMAIEDEEGFRPVKGIREILDRLDEQGYVMAVASSSPLFYVERCIKAIGIDHHFKVVFSGQSVKNSKPAPDTFLEAARLLGASPEECVVIEDSENGTRAGRAAGMFTIGFVNPGSGDQDLSAADVLITDMSELQEVLRGANNEGNAE